MLASARLGAVQSVVFGGFASREVAARIDDARPKLFFFFSSRRRHTRSLCDWSSDVCSSDLSDSMAARLPSAKGVPMVTPDPRAGFSDIDRSADPAEFVRVLDTLTALDFIRAYKRRTFELLGVQPGDSVLDLGC